jgi:hypothetical protein
LTTTGFAEALKRHGVRVSGGAGTGVRMVVHRHIDDESIQTALAAVGDVP